MATKVPRAYNPTNAGWGGATQANDMSQYGYNVPGTPVAPSAPMSDFWATQEIAPWGSPQDYQGAVESQWDYGAAAEAARNQQLADEAAQKSAIGTAAVNYGGDLSGLASEGLIGSDVAAQAAANPTSFMSQLQTALGQGQARDVGDLAARGTLDSGAYGIANANRLRDFQNQSASGMTGLRGQINDIRSGNAQRAQQRAESLRQTFGNVASRLAQDPAYQPRAGQASETAHWDGSFYVTQSGRRFDINGRPV